DARGGAHRPTCPLASVLQRSGAPRRLHPFPTRRSSDLAIAYRAAVRFFVENRNEGRGFGEAVALVEADVRENARRFAQAGLIERSEEHTSELQSRENLVCRLLLEKKKGANGPPPTHASP